MLTVLSGNSNEVTRYQSEDSTWWLMVTHDSRVKSVFISGVTAGNGEPFCIWVTFPQRGCFMELHPVAIIQVPWGQIRAIIIGSPHYLHGGDPAVESWGA